MAVGEDGPAKAGALFLVEWHDSCSGTGWQPLQDFEEPPLLCRSVGWIIHDSELALTLAPNIHVDVVQAGRGGDAGCETMTIPKGAIVRLVPLEEP